jgi:hypothetical protein
MGRRCAAVFRTGSLKRDYYFFMGPEKLIAFMAEQVNAQATTQIEFSRTRLARISSDPFVRRDRIFPEGLLGNWTTLCHEVLTHQRKRSLKSHPVS